MEREDLVRVARYLLALYVFLIAYLLFSPTTPGPRGVPYLDLVGHTVLFFVLGILVGSSALRLSALWRLRLVLVVGAVVGLATELVQGRIPERQMEWSDLAANLLGTMAAAFVLPVAWTPRNAEPEETPPDGET